MLKRSLTLLLICWVLWSVESPPVNSLPLRDHTTISGQIHFVGVEKGCYQLVANDGTKYELIGKFPQQEGLRVKVSGKLTPDLVTICQVGRPLLVTNVQVLKNR